MYICNLLFLFLMQIENFCIWITDVLFFYYLILTELKDTWDEVIEVIIKPGDWIANTLKITAKIGLKFEFEIFRPSMDD